MCEPLIPANRYSHLHGNLDPFHVLYWKGLSEGEFGLPNFSVEDCASLHACSCMKAKVVASKTFSKSSSQNLAPGTRARNI